jgi:hypothetical protein
MKIGITTQHHCKTLGKCQHLVYYIEKPSVEMLELGSYPKNIYINATRFDLFILINGNGIFTFA